MPTSRWGALTPVPPGPCERASGRARARQRALWARLPRSRSVPPGRDLTGHHPRVAADGRQDAHLALAVATRPVQGHGHLAHRAAGAHELDQDLGLAREARLADEAVAVLGIAATQRRGAVDAEERGHGARVEPGAAADRVGG